MYANTLLRFLKYGLKTDEVVLPKKQIIKCNEIHICKYDSKELDTHYLVIHEKLLNMEEISKIVNMSERVSGKLNEHVVEFGIKNLKNKDCKFFIPLFFINEKPKYHVIKNAVVEIDII